MFVIRTLVFLSRFLACLHSFPVCEPDQKLECTLGIGHRRLLIEEFVDSCTMDAQLVGEERPVASVAQMRLYRHHDRIPKRRFDTGPQGGPASRPRFQSGYATAPGNGQLARRLLQSLDNKDQGFEARMDGGVHGQCS